MPTGPDHVPLSALALLPPVLGGTLALLAALTLLGVRVQLGWRRPARSRAARWPHHLLYLLVGLGTLASGALALLSGRPWWPLALLLVPLLLMGRTRAGRRDHWRLASLLAALYLLAALLYL